MNVCTAHCMCGIRCAQILQRTTDSGSPYCVPGLGWFSIRAPDTPSHQSVMPGQENSAIEFDSNGIHSSHLRSHNRSQSQHVFYFNGKYILHFIHEIDGFSIICMRLCLLGEMVAIESGENSTLFVLKWKTSAHPK